MISPTFEPGGSPGEASQVAQQQETTNLSWMQRSQEAALQRQEMEQRANDLAKQTILRPVIEAQALADLGTAKAKIESARIVQEHRQRAAVEAPQALAEFLDIAKNPDLDQKAAQLDAHSAKIAWLGDLPEYKPLLDAVNDSRAKAHIDSIANGKISQAKEAVNAKLLTADAQIEGRAKIAEQQATMKVQMQAADLEHKREVDALNQKIKEMEDKTKRAVLESKPIVANEIAQNKIRDTTFSNISSQRDALSQSAYSISKLAQDIKAEQESALGSGPVAGSAIVSEFRPTARQVREDIGNFANKIMSSVKNIRNVREFNAVTSSIPKASDPADIQNNKLQRLNDMNQVLGQRNDEVEKLLRSNPDMSPDQADQAAVQRFPFPGLESAAGNDAWNDTKEKRLNELKAKLGK